MIRAQFHVLSPKHGYNLVLTDNEDALETFLGPGHGFQGFMDSVDIARVY